MFAIVFVTVLVLIATKTISSTNRDPISFGSERLNDFFFVKNGTVFHQFNHGTYGGTPKALFESQYKYVEQMKSSIRDWMDGATGYRQFTGPESFINPITAALEANASTINIRIAIFSHISAYPSVILSVKELVELFHQYNISVIVDGAHALGNIEINIEDIKSSVIFYVRHDHQHLYVPAPAIVDLAMIEDFESRFIWTGTRDRTPYCAILSALDYRQSLGGEERIKNYNHDLAQYGGRYLSRLWKTKILSPENMQSSITNIQLPTNNFTQCQIIVGQLYNTYNTMVSGASNIIPELGNIPCYLRLSAQIYQEKNDWHVLGALVLNLLKELIEIQAIQ
ncbi:unnamed protein product [Rotaria sordida]|uniref:Aminotransferase class V domain-containing protein n=3 Tax=Rotaria sordida TaxID=392033 RepID=A0A819BHJ4_9BILA|nr:unnamed protein product [Rotaria sordida]